MRFHNSLQYGKCQPILITVWSFTSNEGKKVNFVPRMRITYSEFNISERDVMLAGKF